MGDLSEKIETKQTNETKIKTREEAECLTYFNKKKSLCELFF